MPEIEKVSERKEEGEGTQGIHGNVIRLGYTKPREKCESTVAMAMEKGEV